MNDLIAALERFYELNVGLSKGALSLVLVLTRRASTMKFPLDEQDFVTRKKGQVAGTGGNAVRAILKEHGIERILSSEGGRTSRGNMDRMSAYVSLLNELAQMEPINFDSIEQFWVQKVSLYFSAQPFRFRLDPSHSLRSAIRNLLDQAVARQKEIKGSTFAGTLMQHLVGAKLECVMGDAITRHGASVADHVSKRPGDFLIGDVAVHVTTAPSESLVLKCIDNLSDGLRPLIITTEDGLGGARAMASLHDVEHRIDVVEIEQFMATNLYERSRFERSKRPAAIREIVNKYNEIIDETETDPSLRIHFED